MDVGRIYADEVWHVYGFLAYRLGSRADAEDLTQQTFERALRAASRFDAARGTPRAWLMAIARNLLNDHYRARGREGPLGDPERFDAEASGAAPGPEASVGLDPELASALEALNDRQREILALRFGGDLTGPEIAELTGLSLANVQQITTRALRSLRERLDRVRD